MLSKNLQGITSILSFQEYKDSRNLTVMQTHLYSNGVQLVVRSHIEVIEN